MKIISAGTIITTHIGDNREYTTMYPGDSFGGCPGQIPATHFVQSLVDEVAHLKKELARLSEREQLVCICGWTSPLAEPGFFKAVSPLVCPSCQTEHYSKKKEKPVEKSVEKSVEKPVEKPVWSRCTKSSAAQVKDNLEALEQPATGYPVDGDGLPLEHDCIYIVKFADRGATLFCIPAFSRHSARIVFEGDSGSSIIETWRLHRHPDQSHRESQI